MTSRVVAGRTSTRSIPARAAKSIMTSPSPRATAWTRALQVGDASACSTGVRPTTPTASQAGRSASRSSTVATATSAASADQRRAGAAATSARTASRAAHSMPAALAAEPTTSTMALASSTGPPTSIERSPRLMGPRTRPVAASTAEPAAVSNSTPLKAGRTGPGIRPRPPAIGISAIAPATPAVSGSAGTALRITTATAAIIRAWPCRRSGSSIGLVNQAVPTAPRSHGTALSRMGFSPIGRRVAAKSATSMATVRVTARRVRPSKLDRTR